jgi:hypothetical protein
MTSCATVRVFYPQKSNSMRMTDLVSASFAELKLRRPSATHTRPSSVTRGFAFPEAGEVACGAGRAVSL